MAAAYGWSKTEILETVYFDEIFEFRRWREKREAEHYLELLQIQTSPRMEQQARQNLIHKYYQKIARATPLKQDDKKDSGSIKTLKVLTGGKGKR